jgi:hypothetical protein
MEVNRILMRLRSKSAAQIDAFRSALNALSRNAPVHDR